MVDNWLTILLWGLPRNKSIWGWLCHHPVGVPFSCTAFFSKEKKKKGFFFSKSFTQNRIPFWYLSYGASQVAQVGKEAACNAGDTGETGLIPGLGRCPGGGHGNPLQYSCLEVLMDWGAWWATVPHVTVHNWSDWARTIQKKKKKILLLPHPSKV